MSNSLSVSQIKHQEFNHTSLLHELLTNLTFVQQLRSMGYLTTVFKGYDVIRDVFFCKERLLVETEWECPYEFELSFSSFAEYMDYIHDIQSLSQNACYYQCTKARCEIEKFPSCTQTIIESLLVECAFVPSIDYQMEDILTIYEEAQRKEAALQNSVRKELAEWIDIFIATLEDEKKFTKILLEYLQYVNTTYFVRASLCLSYVFQQICPHDKQNKIPKILFDLTERGFVRVYDIENIIPFYSQDVLLGLYKDDPSYCEATLKKHKRNFSRDVQAFHESSCSEIDYFRYDETTTLFACSERYSYKQKYAWTRTVCFLSLEDMETYAHKNLCDTIVCPVACQKQPIYEVTLRKEYEKESIEGGLFCVTQSLFEGDNCVYENTFKTPYLFDLIYYLNRDLSGMNLVLCDGLDNVQHLSNINLDGVRMQSKHAQKFSVPVQPHTFSTQIAENPCILNNELAVVEQEYVEPYKDFDQEIKIKYISDLHLVHKILYSKCVSMEDIIYLFTQISIEIAPSFNDILIIAGDTSSDWGLFKLFTRILNKYNRGHVIFVPGNHELWSIQNKNQIDSFFENCQEWFEKFNCQHLLQNNLLYLDEYFKMNNIPEDVLRGDDVAVIGNQLKTARCVFFGGLAFAGVNDKYNADAGLYQDVITRQEEIEYSQKFSDLYHKILPVLQQHSSIVATHMPLNDWDTSFYCENIFYISGHTHRNYFYDDGAIKIYADNQVGYKNKKIAAKYFYVNPVYDFLQDVPDGIHEITQDDYIKFMRGRNIHMVFSRDIYKLYALKKMCYYCFIHENKKGILSILNGGQLKHIANKTVISIYNNMDSMIARINDPLTQYSNLQGQVSRAIQNLGGSGTIHGCIVDINFFCHLFVRPDGRIVPYYANNMTHKIVFPSLQALLKDCAPSLHDKYIKLLAGEQGNVLAMTQQTMEPVLYLETDIYRISREIKKMQRLTAGILSYWDDDMLAQQSPLTLPPITIG